MNFTDLDPNVQGHIMFMWIQNFEIIRRASTPQMFNSLKKKKLQQLLKVFYFLTICSIIGTHDTLEMVRIRVLPGSTTFFYC